MLSKGFVNIKTVLQNHCTQCLYWLNFSSEYFISRMFRTSLQIWISLSYWVRENTVFLTAKPLELLEDLELDTSEGFENPSELHRNGTPVIQAWRCYPMMQ